MEEGQKCKDQYSGQFPSEKQKEILETQLINTRLYKDKLQYRLSTRMTLS